jgi:type II secretion system protein J
MKTRGFTLIEMVLALAASAITLAAVYGIFSKAIHLRNDATERTRVSRVRFHAMDIIRKDLTHALISGGVMASVLEGSQQGTGSFPGYLKFMTTTQRDTLNDEAVPANDLQQVEYYITSGPATAGADGGGMLVRAVETNVLAETRLDPKGEELLSGIESMDVEFYDGNSWQTSWTYDSEQAAAQSSTSSTTTTQTTVQSGSKSTTLPKAIRVRIQPATPRGETKPVPFEVLVPWTTQPAIVAATTGT